MGTAAFLFRPSVHILYGGTIFASRRCHQLAYESTREDAGDRATRRADNIRRRLGWDPGIANGEGSKPKWMRWQTFDWLVAKHRDDVNRSIYGIALKLRMIRLLEEMGDDWPWRIKL